MTGNSHDKPSTLARILSRFVSMGAQDGPVIFYTLTIAEIILHTLLLVAILSCHYIVVLAYSNLCGHAEHKIFFDVPEFVAFGILTLAVTTFVVKKAANLLFHPRRASKTKRLPKSKPRE